MKVLKSWGAEGEVVISLNAEDSADFTRDEPVFIHFDELPVPFFIERFQAKGSRYIVKFEDVDSLELAEELVGRGVLLSDEADQDDDASIVGMTVYNEDGLEVGTIVDFDDFAGNTCITVERKGSELMLPIHDDLIIKVEDDSIFLRIPEGLL